MRVKDGAAVVTNVGRRQIPNQIFQLVPRRGTSLACTQWSRDSSWTPLLDSQYLMGSGHDPRGQLMYKVTDGN